MQKKKMKLLTAAIILSGLLTTSPAIAGEETFPIVIDDNQKGKITGGGYSDKVLETSIYQVISKKRPTAYEDYVGLILTPDKTDLSKNYFENNKNTKGNGGVISTEGYAGFGIGDSNYYGTMIDNPVYYYFTNNSAVGNGGAIYVNANIPDNSHWYSYSLASANFLDNQSGKNGGAISIDLNNNDGGIWIGNSIFKNNSAIENGGAIYFNAEKGSDTELSIDDTDFIGNSAKQGSAIYANNISCVNIDAYKKDVIFDNSKGEYGIYIQGDGAYLELGASQKDRKLTINDDIYIKSDTLSMQEIKNVVNAIGVENLTPYNIAIKFHEAFPDKDPDGFYDAISTGIYLDGGSIYYSYNNDGTKTIKREQNTGTIELNGKLDFQSTSGITGFQISPEADGGTLKLGKIPATGTYSVLIGGRESEEYDTPTEFTIDLRNNHAGDTLTIPYLVTTNKDSLLNFKIDFDAATQQIDNIVVNNAGEEFLTVPAPSVKFDLNNIVIFDDESWVDGSTRTIRYLTDNSGRLIDLTEDGKYAFDDGAIYYFTVIKENKGTASVLREEKYISLEDAIKDATVDGYTFRRGDYKLSDDSTGLGIINTEKTSFAINGNNHSLDGNQKDGITVATSGQTLNINDVDEFKNFKTAVTNENGIVNINNSTFCNNEKAINNKGVLNIFAKGDKQVVFKTKTDTIHNVATMNLGDEINNGSIILQDVTDESTPTGIMNVNGATVIASNIINQNQININAGSLTAVAENLNAKITNNADLILSVI